MPDGLAIGLFTTLRVFYDISYSRKENCNLQVADELISFLFLMPKILGKPAL
jgi:hypothetical protein